MALQWSFSEKAGTVTEIRGEHSYTFNFYEGNALMIVTHEFVEDGEERYNLQWFFADELHAKNCLGLTKGHDNMFYDGTITSMTIYRAHSHNWKKIIDLFVQAFPQIRIELLDVEPGAVPDAE